MPAPEEPTTKTVLVRCEGVPIGVPNDRIAYQINGIAGKRWSAVAVEDEGKPETSVTASDKIEKPSKRGK